MPVSLKRMEQVSFFYPAPKQKTSHLSLQIFSKPMKRPGACNHLQGPTILFRWTISRIAIFRGDVLCYKITSHWILATSINGIVLAADVQTKANAIPFRIPTALNPEHLFDSLPRELEALLQKQEKQSYRFRIWGANNGSAPVVFPDDTPWENTSSLIQKFRQNGISIRH